MIAAGFSETREHPIPRQNCDIDVLRGRWMPMFEGKGEAFQFESHEWTRREALSRGVYRQLTFLSLTTEKKARRESEKGR